MSNNIIHENTFRSLYNYLGVVVLLGFFNYLIKYNNACYCCEYYGCFAVLEVYFPNIANFWFSRTGDGRGVTSLAPERLFWNICFFVVADACGSNYTWKIFNVFNIFQLNIIVLVANPR